MSRRHWKPLLDLKLRSSDGVSFQDFVADFLGRLYPGDFIPVRPHGRRGDGGMDGFRPSDGTLYQCYGARQGFVERIDGVRAKMKADFETARSSTPAMRRWLFTHNLIALPRPLVDAWLEVGSAGRSHGIEVGLLGPPMFRRLLDGLGEDDLEDLIGIRGHGGDEAGRLGEAVSGIIERMIGSLELAARRGRRGGIPSVGRSAGNGVPSRRAASAAPDALHPPIAAETAGSFPHGTVALLLAQVMPVRCAGCGEGAPTRSDRAAPARGDRRSRREA